MAKTPEKLEQLIIQLTKISESLSVEETSQLPPPRAKKVRTTITEAYNKLRKVIEGLDPIKHPGFVFDPSNPDVAGRVIGISMIAQSPKPLDNIQRFYGSGVYALYYHGNFPPYAGVSKREHPIYVGKADPARPASNTAMEQGDQLAKRLSEHRKTIMKAKSTLHSEDFSYRALVVKSGYQSSAEEYLIRLFDPLWNSVCKGFGKHGDDPDTRSNQRSPWDTLHPGRDWAHRDAKMKDAKSPDRIVSEIDTHLAKYPPLRTVDEILRKFLLEMRDIS